MIKQTAATQIQIASHAPFERPVDDCAMLSPTTTGTAVVFVRTVGNVVDVVEEVAVVVDVVEVVVEVVDVVDVVVVTASAPGH